MIHLMDAFIEKLRIYFESYKVAGLGERKAFTNAWNEISNDYDNDEFLKVALYYNVTNQEELDQHSFIKGVLDPIYLAKVKFKLFKHLRNEMR